MGELEWAVVASEYGIHVPLDQDRMYFAPPGTTGLIRTRRSRWLLPPQQVVHEHEHPPRFFMAGQLRPQKADLSGIQIVSAHERVLEGIAVRRDPSTTQQNEPVAGNPDDAGGATIALDVDVTTHHVADIMISGDTQDGYAQKVEGGVDCLPLMDDRQGVGVRGLDVAPDDIPGQDDQIWFQGLHTFEQFNEPRIQEPVPVSTDMTQDDEADGFRSRSRGEGSDLPLPRRGEKYTGENGAGNHGSE
jgi:hypothetical protein